MGFVQRTMTPTDDPNAIIANLRAQLAQAEQDRDRALQTAMNFEAKLALATEHLADSARAITFATRTEVAETLLDHAEEEGAETALALRRIAAALTGESGLHAVIRRARHEPR